MTETPNSTAFRNEPPITAIALAGTGGSNAHDAGFLAALQDHARRHGHADGLMPDIEMITCTSGSIAAVATYLTGGDLRQELAQNVQKVDRVTGLPREQWADPLRQAMVLRLTGIPGVFGPYWKAVARHLGKEALNLVKAGRFPWPTPRSFLETWLPAAMLTPERPERWFEEVAQLLDEETRVGIAFNSFDVTTGYEYLYVNQRGIELIKRHHDRKAEYGAGRKHTIYAPITADGLKKALWLLWYGFDKPGQHIDGCYARSVILNELTFADQIYVVKPINDRWLGPLPKTKDEVEDLQTELWLGTSYRQQRSQIELVNQLVREGRIRPGDNLPTVRQKHDHEVKLLPVEIRTQRGYYNYFVEDLDVFDDAFAQSTTLLAGTYADDDARRATGSAKAPAAAPDTDGGGATPDSRDGQAAGTP